MQNHDNLSTLGATAAHPLVARLCSEDQRTTLTFTVHDYQFPAAKDGDDANWYRITIEYESGGVYLRMKTCDFHARSFERFAENLKSLRGYQGTDRPLLSPPYGTTAMISLVTKSSGLRKAYVKKGQKPKLPSFRRSGSGLFIEGEIVGFKFSFKVNSIDLKKCSDAVSAIARTYPTRYRQKGYDINPVEILEAKFRGVKVSDGVDRWLTQWIEDDVQRRVKPVLRKIAKREHRLKNKPNAVTPAEKSQLVAFAQKICRAKVIESYR